MTAINTGNPELDKQLEDWLNWDKVNKLRIYHNFSAIFKSMITIILWIIQIWQNEKNCEEIQRLVEENDVAALSKIFEQRLEFGTGNRK